MCKHSILTSQKCLVIDDVSTFAQWTLSERDTARDTGPVIISCPLISIPFGSVDSVPTNLPSNTPRSTPEQNYLYCNNGLVLRVSKILPAKYTVTSEMHIRNGSLSSSLIGDSLGDEVVLHSLVVLRSVLRRVEVSPQTVTSAEVEER